MTTPEKELCECDCHVRGGYSYCVSCQDNHEALRIFEWNPPPKGRCCPHMYHSNPCPAEGCKCNYSPPKEIKDPTPPLMEWRQKFNTAWQKMRETEYKSDAPLAQEQIEDFIESLLQEKDAEIARLQKDKE